MSDFFGKVDSVPGLFHIATRFEPAFFPISPVESWIVFDRSMHTEKVHTEINHWTNTKTETWRTRWRGVEIPLNKRSIHAAYCRSGLSAAGVISIVAAIWWISIGWTAVGILAILLSVGTFGACIHHTLSTQASVERAIEIAKVADVNALRLARKLGIPEHDPRIVRYKEWRDRELARREGFSAV